MLHKQSSSTIELLKWIAIIAMLFDHISITLLDENEILRTIGRIAFPLFAYVLIHNYIYYTKNKKNYIIRLFIFALISQPLYYLTITKSLNIFILLGISLLTLYLCEQIYSRYKDLKYILIPLQIYTIIFGSIIAIFTSYSLEGYFFLLLLYLGFKKPKYSFLILLSMGLLNITNILFTLGVYSSVGVLYLVQKYSIFIPRMKRWFFYIFYPLHILILYIIQL